MMSMGMQMTKPSKKERRRVLTLLPAKMATMPAVKVMSGVQLSATT